MKSVKIDKFIGENTIDNVNGKICWDFNLALNDLDSFTLSYYDQRQRARRLINEDIELYNDLKTEKMSHVKTDWLLLLIDTDFSVFFLYI